MRAILSVRPKCSHRCVSLKESPLRPVLIPNVTRMSTESCKFGNKCLCPKRPTKEKQSTNELLQGEQGQILGMRALFPQSRLHFVNFGEGAQNEFASHLLLVIFVLKSFSASSDRFCRSSVS